MRKQKWTEEDKRNFHEQNLRAGVVPGRRYSGPLPQEWGWYSDEDRSSEEDGLPS